MNEVSRNYLRQRLQGIRGQKLGEIDLAMRKTRKTCSDQQILRMVQRGTIKLRKGVIERAFTQKAGKNGMNASYHLDTLFDTDKVREKWDQKEYDARRETVMNAFKRAEDELMLGDCDKALEMLDKLQNMKV